MKVMSLQPQPKLNAKRTGKRISFFNDQGVAMKEASQHTQASTYYGIGVPPSGPGHNDRVGVESSSAEAPHMYLNSVIFSPEKGDQSRGHYQQTMPMKWSHQDPSLQPQQRPNTWSQGMTAWPQNFAPYLGVQTAFAKQIHEGMPVQQQQQQQSEPSAIRATDKLGAGAESFKTGRSMDWEQQQTFQQTQKPGVLNSQQHNQSAAGNSVLQPFQLAFGQPKQNLVTNCYKVVQGNRTLPNLNYSTQANSQPQEQQQLMQRQMMLPSQRQQLHPLLEEQIRQQSHQQAFQHQKASQHIPQMQHRAQPPNQTQQQQQRMIELDLVQQLQKSEHAHQNQHVVENYCNSQQAPSVDQNHPLLTGQSQEMPDPPTTEASEPIPQPPSAVLQQSIESHQPGPRRSRRLSKEGGGPVSDNPFVMPTDHQTQGSQNGASETSTVQDIRSAPTGVIQSTRRKRRVSQEANLETLALKASERESLPDRNVKLEPHRPWSPPVAPSGPGQGATEMDQGSAKRPKDDSLMPLVIPVSVPVRQTSSPDYEPASLSASWPLRHLGSHDMISDYKTSVIVTRRRSLRNSLSESSGQNGGTESGNDADGKSAKAKRRPRPEPLFIPPPKLGTFIAPPFYSSITPYQSHLRSPVRMVDNPLNMPPYTPPPILSPVREGSGLYFSTFLSAAAASAAANSQGLPPPATPKSATRSLLRSNSSDITPPVLSSMTEATPVSIEPRINIGSRYQAEVPDLRDYSAVQHDLDKAELLWAPLPDLESSTQQQQRVDELMHLACSSALCGGGTNQELAMHCLYECKGDIMGAVTCLLLKKPIFPKSHLLVDYHYSGSDSWTAEERRLFNRGIAAYKKDFFMVQKVVSSKTVAQCVEFYYTYKKQVKIGRNGTLVYGEAEQPETKPTAEEEVDNKSSQKFESRKEEEDSRKWEGSCDGRQENSPGRVTQSLQASENAAAVLVLRNQADSTSDPSTMVRHGPAPQPKPRPDTTARKSGSGNTGKGTNPEGEFPCKKCGRIFFKVKSRSAHMKSHAEAEKKQAALLQREAEQREAQQQAAVALLAAQQKRAMGNQDRTRRASSDDSSEEEEDADDEDWH